MAQSRLQTKALLALLAVAIIGSFWRVYLRTEVINIGYEIGILKQKEHELIKKQSSLQSKLSRISTKEALIKKLDLAKKAEQEKNQSM